MITQFTYLLLSLQPKEILYGIDALSIDIQRERDHGLPTYTQYRMFCGLSDIASFGDLATAMSPTVIINIRF